MNLRNFLHGSSNGSRTNVLPYVTQQLGLFSRTTNHARTNAVSTMTRIVFPQFSNMWQLSNLEIDSSVIQIVQSDVLRNSVDTAAAITNTLPWGCCIYQTKCIYYETKLRLRLLFLISSQGQSDGELQKDLSAEPSSHHHPAQDTLLSRSQNYKHSSHKNQCSRN